MAKKKPPESRAPESTVDYVALGKAKGYISISEGRITYEASGKSYNFQDPEEPVRACAYVELIEQYKYPPDRIEPEVYPPRREPKLPADLVVYEKDSNKAFIVVETKAEETDEKIAEGNREGLGNATLLDAKYLWVVCGSQKLAYDVGVKPALRDLEKQRIAAIPIAYGKEPKFKYKKGDPQWDLKGVVFNHLRGKFQICHDEIWEGGKRDPAIAFDEMSKLMLAKIYDERFTKNGQYYRFQIGSHEDNTDVAGRVRKVYADAQAKEPDVFKDEIELPPRLIFRLVEVLQDISFSKTDLDVKGRAFENFLGQIFRGEYGQYFTKREIVEFMVEMLQPDKDDIVIDPACGSGGFLLYCIDKVRKNAAVHYAGDQRTIDEIYYHFPRDNIFGIEINDRIARIAMMDMVIHDDGHTNIETNDALSDHKEFSPKRDIRPGKYALLLTNPPFGAKVKDEEMLVRYQLGRKVKKRRSQKTEILFIERCLEFLRPGGRMGIVVPEGILTLSSLQYVRDFIMERAQVLAVVSLPRQAFVPAGAGVKASLLFLRKWREYDNQGADYPIFMAIADHVGYDATDRPDENDLPKIVDQYSAFLTGKRQRFNHAIIVRRKDLAKRLDPYYYQPHFLQVADDLRNSSYELVPLGAILEDMSGGATPEAKSDAYTSADKGLPFLRVQNITEYGIDLTDVKYITRETHETALKRSQLRSGDVLLTITGRVGTAAVVPKSLGQANINQHMVKITLKPDVNPDYVAAFLNSRLGRSQTQRKVTGTTRIALDYPSIKEIQTPIPPREIQDAIVAKIATAYKQKRGLEIKAQRAVNEAKAEVEQMILGQMGKTSP